MEGDSALGDSRSPPKLVALLAKDAFQLPEPYEPGAREDIDDVEPKMGLSLDDGEFLEASMLCIDRR
jgi:hypothetical protein